jgi:hypothetical protein
MSDLSPGISLITGIPHHLTCCISDTYTSLSHRQLKYISQRRKPFD